MEELDEGFAYAAGTACDIRFIMSVLSFRGLGVCTSHDGTFPFTSPSLLSSIATSVMLAILETIPPEISNRRLLDVTGSP